MFKSITSISDKGLKMMNSRYQLLQKTIEKQTAKAIERMQKKELELQKQMTSIDSNKSKKLFAETKAKYEKLKQELASPSPLNSSFAQKVKSYVPGLDNLQTSLKYMEQNETSLPDQKLLEIQNLSTRLTQLQAKLQAATQVQTYLQQRQQFLKQKLNGLPVAKQLVGLNKEAYYYQQRMIQYKAMLNDKDKMKQQLISMVEAQPAFQKFWQKHSILASMFPLTNGDADLGSTIVSKIGLQTRSQVNTMIQSQLGKSIGSSGSSAGGNNSQNYLQQQVQQAKSALENLKAKLLKAGSNTGNSSEVVIPDFTPNTQKTKTFLKRIEYGFSIQSIPNTGYFPATTNLALLLGYKISDKVTVGVGGVYLFGWGTPFKNINFSNQGIGVRSYVDIKAKGSFWITGGLEYSYMESFSSIPGITEADLWQKSALVGVTKKYKVGKKTVNLQALYDLLYNQEIPRGEPIKFRVGYSF
jgi:enamine deaminase RidA (YjgF/YER057c/UK114 family)